MSPRPTVSASKEEFHKEFPYVIPPIYRRLADELLVELHLLSHQKQFKPNALFALGLTTIFNEFTEGYEPKDHRNILFNAICNCNCFNPNELTEKAKEIVSEIEKINIDDIENIIDKDIEDISNEVLSKNNNNQYYSRIISIGLFKLLENLIAKRDKDINNNQGINNLGKKISEKLGFDYSRYEKDLSLYKSNIDKMKQIKEIMIINDSSK